MSDTITVGLLRFYSIFLSLIQNFRHMKKTFIFLVWLLISTVLITSCKKEGTTITNSKLEGTYKGQFMSNNTSETESIIFDNNGTFCIDLTSGNNTSSIKGWYTYDATTNSGVIHHENNASEDFTCNNGEVHIGNNVYCNHPEHETGHSNHHLAGSHHGNHHSNHHDNHHENHHGNHHGKHHN